MFEKLKKRVRAYKVIVAQIKEQEDKQAQYDALVGEHLSYPIIKDLFQTAQAGLIMTIHFKDGSKVVVEKDVRLPDAPDASLF